jgi:hypothetical protein
LFLSLIRIVGPFGTAATNIPSAPTPGDYNDGEICGMMIARGHRSTRRKPAPMPLCPPQTPHAPSGREPEPLRSVPYCLASLISICNLCPAFTHMSVNTAHYALAILYASVSQHLWDRGPVSSFFIGRGPNPYKFTHKYLFHSC